MANGGVDRPDRGRAPARRRSLSADHGRSLVRPAAGLGAHKNGDNWRVTGGDASATALIAGPKPGVDLLLGDLPNLKRLPSLASLALRLAFVAEGKCDAAFAKANAHDWDIAAADIILTEAGGRLTTLDGAEIAYNRPDPVHQHPGRKRRGPP